MNDIENSDKTNFSLLVLSYHKATMYVETSNLLGS